MLIPVRCFCCGKVIGSKWKKFEELIKTTSMKQALDSLKLTRYCCRRIFMTHLQLIDKIVKYDYIEIKNILKIK